MYWWNTQTDEVTQVGAPKPMVQAQDPNSQVAGVPPPAEPPAAGGVGGGLGRVVAEGMAFGVGSSMAHRAVS